MQQTGITHSNEVFIVGGGQRRRDAPKGYSSRVVVLLSIPQTFHSFADRHVSSYSSSSIILGMHVHTYIYSCVLIAQQLLLVNGLDKADRTLSSGLPCLIRE